MRNLYLFASARKISPVFAVDKNVRMLVVFIGTTACKDFAVMIIRMKFDRITVVAITRTSIIFFLCLCTQTFITKHRNGFCKYPVHTGDFDRPHDCPSAVGGVRGIVCRRGGTKHVLKSFCLLFGLKTSKNVCRGVSPQRVSGAHKKKHQKKKKL